MLISPFTNFPTLQASTLDTKKKLALAIIDFLQTSSKDGTLNPEDSESIEIATSCIADTFHVEPANKSHMTEAIGQQNLLQIYSVYEKLAAGSNKGTQSVTSSSTGAAAATSSSQPQTSSNPSATTEESESLKKQGNAAMQQKNYPSAIDLYTRALSLSPSNPIYLSNRAAAYSASSQHALAAQDAELAVAADPSYTKAWSRLGLAKFVLGDARASMEAYQAGIEAEGKGGSEAMRKGFETAKKRVQELEREGDGPAGMPEEPVDEADGDARGAAAAGMPDLSALAGMMGGGAGGGGGGMPDLSQLMNNPMLAGMAQNLMSDPSKLQGLMQNPQLRAMAEQFGLGGGGTGGGAAGAGGGAGAGARAASPGAGAGAGAGRGARGGGGGMPDLASMMQDPALQEM